jgi:isopenicillin N synthase-like dioxygenase
MDQASVPVIDLSGGVDTLPVDQIALACSEWGFFQIVGHGIGARQLAAAMAQTRAFFALPKEFKRAVSRNRDNPWGYYDRELTKNRRDKKEIFDIGPDVAGLQPGDPFGGSTPWPVAPVDFECLLRAHVVECEKLAFALLGALCIGLDTGPDALRACFEPRHSSFLRLNYYPVVDPLGEEGQSGADLGIHHHTDAGALTILLQDDIPGLQVCRDGTWHDVRPMSGALVVNIGDMVQVWSNDRYRAPVHRVLAMNRSDRYSLPFFFNPGYEAVVAPLPTVVSASRPALYSGFSWGEFRRKRADGDFADYGAEVQISDYRTDLPGATA